MNCDLCGKELPLVRARIEGTEMDVCKDCASFGQIIAKPKPRFLPQKRVHVAPEIKEYVVDEFSDIIRRGREKLGLTQKEFALKLNEKESIIHNIETGHFHPSIPLAQKIEKFLKVKLIDKEETTEIKQQQTKKEEYTLGDYIKIKK